MDLFDITLHILQLIILFIWLRHIKLEIKAFVKEVYNFNNKFSESVKKHEID